MAQVNLEADTTEELGDWIDQYPPPLTSEGIDQCCHTEKQHCECIAAYCKICNRGNQQNRSNDNLVLRCELGQLFPIEEDQATSDKVNRIVDDVRSSSIEVIATQPVKHQCRNRHTPRSLLVSNQEAEERERRERAVISYSDEDYSVLQKIVQAEAGVCDDRGKILVANVIINRVKNKKFPNSVKAVVYEPSQFSPVLDGTINSCKVTQQTIDCVNRALEGEDYSGGALYFMNRGISASSNVRWFDGKLTYVMQHGGHEFYK